jgi:hypothetical protein
MRVFSIYKEIQPTYGEWLPILEQLGYQKHVIEKKNIFGEVRQVYRLENPVEESIIILPYLPDEAPVLKGIFADYSIQLYWQGIIEDEQAMAKMIEKNRLSIEKSTPSA